MAFRPFSSLWRWQRSERAPSPAESSVTGLDWRMIRARYSGGDLALIIVGGVVAVILTGFLGYAQDPDKIERQIFSPAPVLFAWFCALIVLFVVRHPALRGRVLAPLVVVLISIFLVAAYYVDNTFNRGALLSELGKILQLADSNDVLRLLATVTNFGVLVAYALVITYRLLGRRDATTNGGPAPNAQSDQSSDALRTALGENYLTGETLSGDLLAGALLCGALALFFSQQVFSRVISFFFFLQQPVNICTVSLYSIPCSAKAPIFAGIPLTLFDIDWRIGGICFALSLFILFIASGANALRGDREPAPTLRAAFERIIVEIARTLVSAALRVLSLRRIFSSLSVVLWPLFMLASVFSAALATRYFRCNLAQIGGDQPLPGYCQPRELSGDPTTLLLLLIVAVLIVVAALTIGWRLRRGLATNTTRIAAVVIVLACLLVVAFVLSAPLVGYSLDDPANGFLLMAYAYALVMALTLIAAIALIRTQWRAMEASALLGGMVGFVLLVLLWLPSLALAVLNHIVPLLNRYPFQLGLTQLGPITLVSLAAFVLSVLVVLLLRERQPETLTTPVTVQVADTSTQDWDVGASPGDTQQ